jgi:hypothetical protein
VVPVLGGIVENFLVLAAELYRIYLRTISSKDLFSQSVPLIKLFRFVM